jgi:hypothetical protein
VEQILFVWHVEETGPSEDKVRFASSGKQDTEGVAFHPSTLDDPSSFSVPSHVFKAFHRPATERLLNYGGSTAKEAVQRMQDRNNPNRLQEAVPPGLSQISHLPSEDGESIK